MNATATHAAHPAGRTELTRYTVPSAGERILYGLRTVHGEAILIDMPAGDEGRVYLVERGLEQDGNAALQALISDYLTNPPSTTRSQLSATYSTDREAP